MRRFATPVFSVSCSASLFLALSLCAGAATATHGMVASVHPVATEAGLAVLKSGGNAVDAAAAVAFMLGVVDGDNSGLGGGTFMLIRLANGSFAAIDGRETAPAAATRDMFLRNGKAEPDLSQTGALASGVPGALAAYEYAVTHYGRKPLKELILPAAEVAEKGFRIDVSYARRLKLVAEEMARFESTRAVFFNGNKPMESGSVLKQTDLAASYRRIAEQGSEWFYRGPFAQALEKWMKANGGVMTAQDLSNYHVVLREPLVSTYRGYQIVTFPPPSSGGVHLVEMLNILEKFDLQALAPPARLHVMAEAMKLAFADRAYWLGDPDFAHVPRGLVDKDYGTALATRIDLNKTTQVAGHGSPPDWQSDVFRKHTTHFSIADAEGNWVACTTTVNTSFGSKVVIPGTGIVMNDQMDDFSAQPGVTNYFGLLGAEANAVAPGKRPLSSMTPTIVLKGNEPMISLGAAGGPRIISTVLLELVSLLDLGRTPKQAVDEPRIHHQWFPDELMVEKALPGTLQDGLRQRGHRLRNFSSMAVSQIVARSPDGLGFLGAADPRAGGKAAGW